MEIEEDYSEDSQDIRNESSEEEDEYNNQDNALYNTDYNTEQIFFEQHKDLFYPPSKCPKCNKESIRTNILKKKFTPTYRSTLH